MEEKIPRNIQIIVIVVLGIGILILGGRFLMSLIRDPIVSEAPGALKTYANTHYHYSFKYVGVVNDAENGDVVVRPAAGSPWKFTIRVLPTVQSASAPRAGTVFFSADGKQGSDAKPDPNVIIEDVQVAGQPAQFLIHKNFGNYGNAEVVITHGTDTITIFGDNSTPETEVDLKNFLSGFTFNN